MSESSLAKKLQIRPAHHVLALHAPDGLEAALSPLPEGATLDHRARGQHDVVLVFAASKAEVDSRVPAATKALKQGGVFWICWPKGSAHVPTDLNRDILFRHAQSYGLQAVSNVSIDEVWSALRFKPR
jgi:hypothetical protein